MDDLTIALNKMEKKNCFNLCNSNYLSYINIENSINLAVRGIGESAPLDFEERGGTFQNPSGINEGYIKPWLYVIFPFYLVSSILSNKLYLLLMSPTNTPLILTSFSL